jgi:hypothetical protein
MVLLVLLGPRPFHTPSNESNVFGHAFLARHVRGWKAFLVPSTLGVPGGSNNVSCRMQNKADWRGRNEVNTWRSELACGQSSRVNE